MALTPQQGQALADALVADKDPVVVDGFAKGSDNALIAWCNAESAVDVWHESMTRKALFLLTDIDSFAALSDGRRDAWRMLLEAAPIDCTNPAMRDRIASIWGAESVPILQGCRRKATNGEGYLGGGITNTNGVEATELNHKGAIDLTEMSRALNKSFRDAETEAASAITRPAVKAAAAAADAAAAAAAKVNP